MIDEKVKMFHVYKQNVKIDGLPYYMLNCTPSEVHTPGFVSLSDYTKLLHNVFCAFFLSSFPPPKKLSLYVWDIWIKSPP